MRLSVLRCAPTGLALLASCGDGTADPEPQATVALVEVAAGAGKLSALGRTTTFTAIARTAGGDVIAGRAFAWTSTQQDVASVDPASGVVTATGPGTATIRATTADITGGATILVEQFAALVTINADSALLTAIEATRALSAIVRDSTANPMTSVSAAWTSRDNDIATVSVAGLVTAQGAGEAFIIAASGTGLDSTLAIVDQEVASISIVPPPVTVKEGDSLVLSVTAADANGFAVADPDIGWLAADAQQAAVDDTGLVVVTGRYLSIAGHDSTRARIIATHGPLRDTAEFNVAATFVQVAATLETFTCVRTDRHALYCIAFGADPNATRPVPVRVPGGHRFASVTGGSDLACGSLQAPAVATLCFGENEFGQLGNGTTGGRSFTPSPVSPPGGVSFTTIAIGSSSSCGIAGSFGFCWGTGGRLGNGTSDFSPTPVAVSGGHQFTLVTVGQHACGLATTGAAYCWGSNINHALGNSTVVGVALDPVAVLGGLTFRSLSAGFQHTCGVTTTNAGYCWGANTGRLGDGSVVPFAPEPVPVSGGLPWDSIWAGVTTSCGITTTGQPYCWGENSRGELGDGGTAARGTPGPVSGGLTFASLAMGRTFFGGSYVCGRASNGYVYCWGDNRQGQAGPPVPDQRYLVPTRLQGQF